MKKYIFKVAFVVSLLTLASCNKDLEAINLDPNKPLAVPNTGLFTNANRDILNYTRGGFSSGRMALPWVQYSAQRNYTAEDRYQYRTDVNKSLYTNIWLTVKNYKTILDNCDNPAKAAEVASWGNVNNQRAAARIMIAYSQLQLVDMYGDIPYYSYGSDDPDFQAMRLGTADEITTPVFASQEKIYADLMNELKESAESIEVGGVVFNGGDQIFGSALKMKRFANSLRLRIAVRVQSALPELAQTHIAEAIAGGVMESNDDSVSLKFQADKINPAPMYEAAFVSNRNDFAPTNTFVNLLKGEGKAARLGYTVDPRLYKMVTPITNLVNTEVEEGVFKDVETTVRLAESSLFPNLPNVEKGNYVTRPASFYAGFPVGLADAMTASQRSSSSQFGYEVYRADYALVFMDYSEVEFLLSEVNGFSQDHYIKGIEASMQKWGVTKADIDAYLATVPAASQENVLTQKYISLYMIPYEAWADYRRTGFPKTLLLPGESHKLNAKYESQEEYTFVSLVSDVTNDLPERIKYSADLDLVNKDNKEAAAARMGGDKMSTKLIWARK